MEKKVIWYNDPQRLGTLLLFFPPVGIYGVYKSETLQQKWKTITYATVILVGILLLMLSLY